MNKTSKLFYAAILLLCVMCKDAPMTEPSPIKVVECAYDSKNSIWILEVESFEQKLEIPVLLDSCSFHKQNGEGQNEQIPDGIRFVVAAVNHQDEMYICAKNANIEMFAGPSSNFNIKTDRGYIVQNQTSGKLGYSLFQNGSRKEMLSLEYDNILEVTVAKTNQSWVIGRNSDKAVKIITIN